MNNLVDIVDLKKNNDEGNFITNPPRTLEQFLQLSNMARDLPTMWLSTTENVIFIVGHTDMSKAMRIS